MADMSSKAQAHADWLINGLSTKEVITKYDVLPKTAQGWIKQWHQEQIRTISDKLHFSIKVTEDAMQKHASNVQFLASELDSAASAVQSCAKGSKERREALSSYLKLEKRWSELTGIEAKIASNRAGEVEAAKNSVQTDKTPTNKLQASAPKRVSGPVVPID